ncbi:MAG TPA: diguanylate cyclase [Gemmatimonadales bacterium]|nr:diguanylate cyclase [Gemmatimonadales bacterium]
MTPWQETVARRLRAMHLDSIRRQVLVLGVAAAVVPALTILVLASRQNHGSPGDRVARELRGVSAEAAWDVGQWLDERLHDLRVGASSYTVSENLSRVQGRAGAAALGRLRDYLNSVRERSADCDALVLLDARGHVVAGSGSRMSGVQFALDKLNGLRTGEALVGDAYWDLGLSKAAITLAVPIRDADGRFLGALTAKINLRGVADILERLSAGDGDTAVPAQKNDVYVTTDQGRLILKSRLSSAELMRTKLPAVATQALLDKEGTLATYERADRQEVVGTLRRLPALHWAAVVERPRAALQEEGGLGAGTVASLVLLLAAVGTITGLLALLIVRPLRRLTVIAERVAAGDLSMEVPVGGSGEVGLLSQVFKTLLTRVRERDSQGELERLSVTDALTGLYNRRHLMGTLANEVQRSRRLRRTFSVLLGDVDRFKQYNDTHGHLAGDAALVKIAEILRKTTRGVDSVARYGGEEFVVMLIEAPIATALTVAERIRARVAAEQFEGGAMTVSIGAAEYPAHGDTPEELIASADAAMYDAKGAGRDRVVAARLGDLHQGKGRKARKEADG